MSFGAVDEGHTSSVSVSVSALAARTAFLAAALALPEATPVLRSAKPPCPEPRALFAGIAEGSATEVAARRAPRNTIEYFMTAELAV
jgi:hypothetical protein